MSASPSSRTPAQNIPHRPFTPDQTRPSMARASSLSVAPKSEYLRHALQARRAHQSTTPSPLEMRHATPPRLQTPENRFTTSSPDVFDEFELSEEQTRPVSPIRRRRPSESGIPRSKTTRQLTDEMDKLKELLITSNMRVELLKKNNSELQYGMTKLQERVEQLEPVVEENAELRDDNVYLTNKMQETEEEIERLKDENEHLRKSNEELLSINEECSSHFEDQELAVQEAADAIVALEGEKAALAGEVQELKKRVSALEYDSARARTLIDGSPRCPSRVHSIDESRPSTSHFDSDYYSQPDSPAVKSSKESVFSITPSERSKKFLDLTQERRRSARDLAKRMSMASLASLRVASSSPAPTIPQISAEFQQQTPQTDNQSTKATRRHRERRLPEYILQEALQISPTMPEPPAEQAATPVPERPRRSHQSDHSNDSRPSSRHARTPTSTRPRTRKHSTAEISPRVPSRRSSKQAHTNSSNEYLSQRDQQNPRQHRSVSDMGSAETPRNEAEEWAPMSPPPDAARASLLSNASVTSEVDSHDKDRWWRSVQPLTHSLPHAQSQQQQQQSYPHPPPHAQFHNPRLAEVAQQTPRSPTLTRSQSHHQDNKAPGTPRPAKLDTTGTFASASNLTRRESRKTRTQPSTPAATSPFLDKDFFFNATEDADAFMRKAKAKMMGGRKS
jgi:predicted  nucleic acid-binding Zn-ribbon protein